MNEILNKGKKFLFGPQTTILSAATIIMVMMLVSRLLGYVRVRTITHFFPSGESALFFAGFRLPDSIFEILVFGTFSSAFIPVFAKLIKRGNGEAWDTASRVVNLGLLIYLPIAFLAGLFAHPIYNLITPGFADSQIETIAVVSRILFFAQAFFIVSYVLTGVLESLHRFLVPALAPLFYNLGIILSTIFLSPQLGILAPAVGAVIGALLHLLIQLPFAVKMGFRFSAKIAPSPEVRKIGRLALPRLLDVFFQQGAKIVELNLASIISSASYTYLTLANTLQLLPVSLLGTTVAKAALPTLSQQEDNHEEFKNTLLSTIYQVMFLIFPVAALFVVLRVPIVRLAFGTDIFEWEDTIQTSLALSAFAVGIPFQAAVAILSRAYYALHDTKTPVFISIVGVLISTSLSFVFIHSMHLPAWSLAAAFSTGVIVQSILLFLVLETKLANLTFWGSIGPILKSLAAAFVSGTLTFFLVKFFDRSVWIKRLSFLNSVDSQKEIPFQRFVLDTRYTFNLIILVIGVSVIGFLTYIFVSWILGSQELKVFVRLIKKFHPVSLKPQQEMISTPQNDTSL